MAKSRGDSNRKTAARMVIEVLHKKGAYNKDTAIVIEEFQHLKLTSAVIAFTIGNMMKDNIIVKTEEDTYYFDQDEWTKLEKKVNRGYLILVGVPFVAILIFLLIQFLSR